MLEGGGILTLATIATASLLLILVAIVSAFVATLSAMLVRLLRRNGRSFAKKKSDSKLKRRLPLLKSRRPTPIKCAFVRCRSPLKPVGLRCFVVVLKPLTSLTRLRSVNTQRPQSPRPLLRNHCLLMV